MPETPPTVLTIAGFDPSSGAGITADIKTIAMHRCYGVAAITAMTVQSTGGVRRTVPTDPKLLRDTLDELVRDGKVSAVHIGMLGNRDVVSEVAGFLERTRLPNIVLDPVLRSSSGAELLDQSGREFLTRSLLPLADVLTPNVDEAACLVGIQVGNPEQMKLAAERLHSMGSKAVVVTGGHLDCAVDLLSVRGKDIRIFRADHLDSNNTHGTGCAFSTALACQLALGHSLPVAVLLAKAYVLMAIKNSYATGQGRGPINHTYGLLNRET